MQETFQPKGIRRQIVDVLRERILAGEYPPNERLESVRVLAGQFGVCVYTMTQAVLELSKEGLVRGRSGSGVYVTDWQKNRHVGIMCELDVSHPNVSCFYPRVIQQLACFLEDHGIKPKVYYTGRYQPGNPFGGKPLGDFLADLRDGHLRGLAILALDPSSAWVEQLKKTRIPVVGGGIGSPPVEIDEQEKVRQGVRYLLAKGRRNVAVMDWGATQTPWSEETALRQVIQEAGGEVRREWICTDLNLRDLRAGWDGFHKLWTARSPKPDGLLICDDMLLTDVAMAILHLRINVPHELLVASHVNKGFKHVAPFPITCMEYDPDQYARGFGEIMLDRLNGKEVPTPRPPLPFEWKEIPGLAPQLPAETISAAFANAP